MSDVFPWFEFLALMAAFSVGAVVPGPDFAMVLRQAITYGRKTAIVTSLGVASAIFVHGAYTVLGLGLIVSQSIFLFTLIKIIGAGYLLWLGITTIKSAPPKSPKFNDNGSDAQQSVLSAFIVGFLTNLLNPKAVLFFVALFSTTISADTSHAFKAIYVSSMAAVLLFWFVLVSVFFTTAKVRNVFYQIGKWFNRVTGATLVLLAIRVAITPRN